MKNVKYLLCVLVGILLTIGIGSAYNLNASLVTYDKKNTTLESEDVQDAIDELYTLVSTNSNIELLWTNLNPNATFAAQTIELDLSKYNYVIIGAHTNNVLYEEGEKGFSYLLAKVDPISNNFKFYRLTESYFGTSTTMNSYNAGNTPSRGVIVTNSGVQFSNGALSGQINNIWIVPILIYGINIDL